MGRLRMQNEGRGAGDKIAKWAFPLLVAGALGFGAHLRTAKPEIEGLLTRCERRPCTVAAKKGDLLWRASLAYVLKTEMTVADVDGRGVVLQERDGRLLTGGGFGSFRVNYDGSRERGPSAMRFEVERTPDPGIAKVTLR
jgi:hypothetical protein